MHLLFLLYDFPDFSVCNLCSYSTGFTSVHGEGPSAEYAKLRKESLETEFGATLGTYSSKNLFAYYRFGPFLALYRAAIISFQVAKLTICHFFLQDIHKRAVKVITFTLCVSFLSHHDACYCRRCKCVQVSRTGKYLTRMWMFRYFYDFHFLISSCKFLCVIFFYEFFPVSFSFGKLWFAWALFISRYAHRMYKSLSALEVTASSMLHFQE